MEIGNQIKTLRLRRGTTQEALAQHLGVTAQAVSKWERGAATPDIGILPDISAYFGVTIDELFALSDDTRMERIQNMLWDDRYYDPNEVESTREFLLAKARKNRKTEKFMSIWRKWRITWPRSITKRQLSTQKRLFGGVRNCVSHTVN